MASSGPIGRPPPILVRMVPDWIRPFCSTTPIWRRSARRSSDVSGKPSNKTEPAVGVSKPRSKRRMVLFPLPDGPTIATYSPGSMVKDNPFSTGGVSAA